MHLVFVLGTLLAALALANAGEDQWAKFWIHNRTNKTLAIEAAKLKYGKWVGSNFKEIKSPSGKVVQPREYIWFMASGRWLSPTGVEGSFEVRDKNKGSVHLTVTFDHPYSGKASFKREGTDLSVRCEDYTLGENEQLVYNIACK